MSSQTARLAGLMGRSHHRLFTLDKSASVADCIDNPVIWRWMANAIGGPQGPFSYGSFFLPYPRVFPRT